MIRRFLAGAALVVFVIVAIVLAVLVLESARHPFTVAVPFLALVFAVLFYRTFLGRSAQVRRRARSLRWRVRLRLRPGPGYASLAELWFRWGRSAALAYGRRVYGREEEQTLILAPQRVGKSGMLADWILSHQGPLLVTTTRGDLYRLTAATRAQQGPVDVFNPEGVSGIGSTFAWDMLGPCRDVLMAHRMAQWLTGGITSRSGHGDLEWFEQKGDVALQALLWAAAVGGYAIADVFRWVLLDGHQQALNVLASHPGSSREMLAIARRVFSEDRTHASIRATMELSLAWAAVPQLAAAVTPGHTEGFDLDRFLALDGSVYLVASGDDDSPLTPLFRAFASWLHYSAGFAGTLTPAGRLSRPLFEALDELAVICPVDLPAMLADSAGKGIRIAAVAHSTSQLADRWGEHGAKTIWALCGTKILFGGISDTDTLEDVSKLCGSVIIGRDSRPFDSVQAAPPDFLRMMPTTWALIIRLNLFPVVVKTRPAWKRLSYRFGRAPVYVPRPATAWAEGSGDTVPLELPERSADLVPDGFPYAGSLIGPSLGSGGDD